MTKRSMTKVWAERTPERVAEVAGKIAERAKERWEKVTDPEARSAKTAVARASIDRQKQGAAASKGLKTYWAELKADPVRYAEYKSKRGWK